jgi:hypothetical protein
MTFNISVVGFRWQCSKYIRAIHNSNEWGVIKEVELKRVGWFTWYLKIDVERK